MEAKSLALSVVNSWPAMAMPDALACLVNSAAMPWPKAVRSSITPTVLTFKFLAA